eukprot:296913-Chlamydomonas_euryale.AAC.2
MPLAVVIRVLHHLRPVVAGLSAVAAGQHLQTSPTASPGPTRHRCRIRLLCTPPGPVVWRSGGCSEGTPHAVGRRTVRRTEAGRTARPSR